MSNSLDLDHFRALLERRLAELESTGELGESRNQAVELDQTKVGRLSRMDALQQQAMLDATKARAEREKIRIKAALRRMAAGEYGDCVQCTEPIAPGRLAFDPAAPLCVTCANKS